MARTTPEQAAADWASALASRTDKITKGVQGVTVAPGAAAARQKAVYLQNVTAKADKWARNTAAVPLTDWQTAMTQKGVPRIAQGAQAAQGKFASFMNQLLPYQDRLSSGLPTRGNLDQNIARMTAWVRGMSQFQKSGS